MIDLQTWAIVTIPFITGIGLYFAYQQLKKQQETRELVLVETIMKNLNDRHDRLLDNYEKWDDKKKQIWDIQFLNELEWLSFLFNEGKIRDDKLKKFWTPSILKWYDEILLKRFKKKDIEDKTKCAELKKFCKNNK